MYTGLYTSVSGSIAQEKSLAILSHNLSNISTVGFKAERPLFQMVEPSKAAEMVTFADPQDTIGMSLDPLQGRHSLQQELVKTHIDFSQGTIRQTGNPLDLALQGDGFFAVETPDGTAYTRQGTFTVNADGFLSTQDGFIVQGETGPIEVRDAHITIDHSGRVHADGNPAGQLKLTDFEKPYPLFKQGSGLFRTATPQAAEIEPETLSVHQGALEESNSQPIRLLSETISTTRVYEAYQRAIRAFDEMAGQAVNNIAKTR